MGKWIVVQLDCSSAISKHVRVAHFLSALQLIDLLQKIPKWIIMYNVYEAIMDENKIH